MTKYYNLREVIVEKKLDEVWKDMNCCKCEICRDDIIALTLNKLPPKYVSTKEGELYGRATEYTSEKNVEVISQLTRAIKIVSKNQRHDSKKST